MQLSNGDSARCCGWACGRKTGSSTSRERQAFSGSKIAPLRQQQRLSERRAFWRFLALKAAPLRQQQHLSERQALLALQQRLCSLFFHRGGCVEVRDKRAAAPQQALLALQQRLCFLFSEGDALRCVTREPAWSGAQVRGWQLVGGSSSCCPELE